MSDDPIDSLVASVEADLGSLRRRAADLAYGLGCALWLHPDGRIRVRPDDGDDPVLWERIEAPPGAKPTEHGHTLRAQAQTNP